MPPPDPGAARIYRPSHAEFIDRAPFASPVAVFDYLRRLGRGPVILWRSPENEFMIAAGAATALSLPGGRTDWRNEFRESAELTRDALENGKHGRKLRAFFSLHFDPAYQNDAEEWKDFPAVEFVIPSFLLRQDEHGAAVSLAGGFEDVNEWKRQLPLLETADAVEMPVAAEPLYAELEWNEAPFTIVVEQAVRSLRRRAIDKVVLARRALVKPERSIILPRALKALNDGYTDCFLYAHCPTPDVCFMSATPERLAAVDAGRISAVAMAGTMPTGKNLVEEQNNRKQLQTNAKIWKEHSLVVEMIHHVLGEICDEVKMDSPEILRLRNVQHLVTPLNGLLKEGKRLTDAVALLHPTPAVCGVPRDIALGMIRTLENFPRGRFAGAAGWFDGNGNGDAAVTIRAALLRERSAVLYGGAGILADSSIKQEVDETRFKMQAVLSALAQG